MVREEGVEEGRWNLHDHVPYGDRMSEESGRIHDVFSVLCKVDLNLYSTGYITTITRELDEEEKPPEKIM